MSHCLNIVGQALWSKGGTRSADLPRPVEKYLPTRFEAYGNV